MCRKAFEAFEEARVGGRTDLELTERRGRDRGMTTVRMGFRDWEKILEKQTPVELGPATGVEFAAREIVPHVDYCSAKGPPVDGRAWTRKRDKDPRAEKGNYCNRADGVK
jgi:hypothetical protein